MAVRGLLSEAMTGRIPGLDSNFFVERDEGLLPVCEGLSAAEASVRLPGCSSVAAHVDHARYYMKLGNDFAEGWDGEMDWEGSWTRQVVDEESWAEILSGLRSEWERFSARLDQNDLSVIEEVGDAVVNVAHAAYHLGAVRTLIGGVRAFADR